MFYYIVLLLRYYNNFIEYSNTDRYSFFLQTFETEVFFIFLQIVYRILKKKKDNIEIQLDAR